MMKNWLPAVLYAAAGKYGLPCRAMEMTPRSWLTPLSWPLFENSPLMR